MRVYVLGAGASCPIYPLAGNLLGEISAYIESCGACFNRFDYAKWPEILKWLAESPNPLLREAYHAGNLEQIFTVLDLAVAIQEQSQIAVLAASRQGIEKVNATLAHHKSVSPDLTEYEAIRNKLLWATEHYFEYRHHEDLNGDPLSDWAVLDEFGQLLEEGDVIITFNYDSIIERVLRKQCKWSPSNGYELPVIFQKSRHDKTRLEFENSKIKILHLHGTIGWHRKPHNRSDYPLFDGAAFPAEALSPGLFENSISLDPLFLRDMGIFPEVDASLPDRPSLEYRVLLAPSFLKDYEAAPVFLQIWQIAGEALRKADKIVIIGYSLPPADSAAMTLLLSNCEPNKIEVVNPSANVLDRYRRLLKLPVLRPKRTLSQWLEYLRKNAGSTARVQSKGVAATPFKQPERV